MESVMNDFIPSVEDMENITQDVVVPELVDLDDQDQFEHSGDMVVVNGRHMPVEMRDDFDNARTNLKSMLSKGMTALDDMLKLAKDSEHPRLYDSLTQMMNTMGSLNKQLVEIVKEKHKIHQDLKPADVPAPQQNNTGAGVVNNNTIFVGSTKELQDFFAQSKMAQEIPA